MKLRITFACLLSMVLMANAQQDPQFSQNMFNRLMFNPGYAGTSGAICVTGINRSQWMGFEGAPKTFVLGLDMPIQALNGGIGLTLVQDKIGVENNVYAKLAYSYHLKLKQGTLGLGLDLGMMNKNIGAGLNPIDKTDGSIPQNAIGSTVFDAGIGAYYTSKTFYAGLSSTHLPQSTFDLGTSKYQSRRHYYITAGYHYQLNPDVEIRPSIFIKNAAATQFDINCNVFYKNKYWGGLSYRLQDAVILMLGADVYKGLKVGIAYDVNTSTLSKYNSNTLEILLNYCFKIKIDKPRQIYRNVRYL